jgi:hypothetical protein
MKSRWTQGQLQRVITLTACVMTALLALACDSGLSETGSRNTDASQKPGAANVVEKTAQMGQSVEVANLTATVTEVHRQRTFGENADAGYVVASVTVANKSTAAQDYHRLQWALRLPDGSSTNRTPIVGQTQLGQGTLEPGAQAEGQLIFTVGPAGGDFALVFEPRQDDKPERERGLWPFASQPGEAR